MQYEIKAKFMEILAGLRFDLDKAGEHVRDENPTAAANLLGDIERDAGAIKGVLSLIQRRQSPVKQAPGPPVEECPL